MESKINIIKRAIVIALFCTSALYSTMYFEVKIDSCTLKIPKRYNDKMIFNTPNQISFMYKEEKDANTTEAISKNFLLTHKITILRKKNNEIVNENNKNFNLISKRNINGIQIYRFKGKIKNSKEWKQESINMFNQNNYFHIFGNDFYIVGQETDKYIDDIYHIIEDCQVSK